MICLDIYDEENQVYTPYNFLDFCGFECRYNDITGMYVVNGFINGAMTIASFEDEELAIAVTRSLLVIKSTAEENPQPKAYFINVDMIVDKLENMDEEEEDNIDDGFQMTKEIEQKIEETAYFNAAKTFICIFIGIIIGYFITSMVI